jgi:hypothetical protein
MARLATYQTPSRTIVHQPSSNIILEGHQDLYITNHHAFCAFDMVEEMAGTPYLAKTQPIYKPKN